MSQHRSPRSDHKRLEDKQMALRLPVVKRYQEPADSCMKVSEFVSMALGLTMSTGKLGTLYTSYIPQSGRERERCDVAQTKGRSHRHV